MNKYQEALNKVLMDNPKIQLTTSDIHSSILVLKKLVDKETQKKLVVKRDKDGRELLCCPTCGYILHKFWSEVETVRVQKYCEDCGQRLEY